MNKLKIFVEGKTFQNFILGIIIFNSLLLGLMTIKNLNETFLNVLIYIDIACLIIYIIEMLLKLIAYNVIGYFKNFWNCFDFVIIVCSILSEFTSLSSIKIMRSLRIFRSLRSISVLKLISSIESLQKIMEGIAKSIPTISWTTVLILFIFYIFSIIGVTEFGMEFQDWFGTIPRAMFTLFQVMTIESWSMGISRPVMEKFPYSWLYFIPFLIISSYILISIITGFVVNALFEVNEDKAKEKEAKLIEKCNTKNIKSELDSLRDHVNILKVLIKKGNYTVLDKNK